MVLAIPTPLKNLFFKPSFAVSVTQSSAIVAVFLQVCQRFQKRVYKLFDTSWGNLLYFALTRLRVKDSRWRNVP